MEQQEERQEGSLSINRSIYEGLMGDDSYKQDSFRFNTRGEELEYHLTKICEGLGFVGDITKGNADIDFILSIVGSYLIAKKNNKLDLSDIKHPYELFDERLFPILDEASDVIVEEIEHKYGKTN